MLAARAGDFEEAGNQVQCDGQQGDAQCWQVAQFRAGQQGQGLQSHGQYQQNTGQALDVQACAFVVLGDHGGEKQVEQAEQCQVNGLRLLQQGHCIGS
ncbi:hypothetical protein D3C75_906220 [compost metagenome]